MISIEYQEGVALIRLNRSVINEIGPDLVKALGGTLDKVKDDPQVSGVVLSSANHKFFSIGLDLPSLLDITKEDFALFWKAFNGLCLNLFTFPKPTVAAITGHATAGGCVLALCCDYRMIAEGKKMMGLNEIRLGVPVPYVADCILRNTLEVSKARDIMESGQLYPPPALIEMGLVDQVLPLDRVLPEATQKAELLGSHPRQAFAVIKSNRVLPVKTEILERLEEKEKQFVECWYSDEARGRLKEAMKRF